MKRGSGHSDDASKAGKPEPSDSVSDSDADHFARAMADVVPLSPDPRGRVRSTHPIRSHTPPILSSSAQSDDDEGLEAGYVAHGVDRRELRRLKRGEHAAGHRLDLHGQTAAEAVKSVRQFIDTSRHRHRAVCIVHGRGLHSEGHVSILKARVREFLRHHPAVLAYSDAPRTDGGAGAVYVLLRK